MSDSNSTSAGFSVSFNLDAGNSVPHSPELLSFHAGEAMPLNASTSLWLSQVSGESAPIPNFLVDALSSCVPFMTLEQHVQRLLPNYRGQLDANTLRGALQGLVTAGLFESSAAYCQRFNEQMNRPACTVTPTRVFIVTCDRSPAVERILASVLANANLEVHEALFVLDDSRDVGHAQRNREIVLASAVGSPIPLHYFGQTEKQQYLERVLESESDLAPSIDYLLDRNNWPGRKTYGLARNWALLLSAGRRCLMVDDDALCVNRFLTGDRPGHPFWSPTIDVGQLEQ